MSKKSSGFTVIEVSLVLTIAGLIFLMAFIALPSLWASQRDSQRKANVMSLVSAIKTYQTNNSRGALPTGTVTEEADNKNSLEKLKASAGVNDTTSWAAFLRDYINIADYKDPDDTDKTPTKIYVVNCTSSSTPNTVCNTSKLNNFNSVNNTTPTKDLTYYIAIGATCDGDHAVKANSNRGVAIVYALERGGRYCDNT